MRPIPPLVLFGMMFGPVQADTLDAYRWQARPILVFGPAADDPRVTLQLARLTSAQSALIERDCVVIVDTAPASPLRARFDPGDFAVILVCKDGTEQFRSTDPIQPDTLTGLIDAMPNRMREMTEL